MLKSAVVGEFKNEIIETKHIIKYLDDKQIKHSSLGFGYIITAIKICLREPKYRNKTCALYEKVGLSHNTTSSRAERAIRHSIEYSGMSKITNSEFIAVAVDYFTYEFAKNHEAG